GVEVGFDGISARQHFVARQTSEACSFCSLPLPTPVAGKITESSLQALGIPTAGRLQARHFIGEAVKLAKDFRHPVLYPRSFWAQFTQLCQTPDQVIDLALRVKRITSPSHRKIAMLRKICGGVT